MTEREKMLAGELYRPSDPDLTQQRLRARLLFQKANSLPEAYKKERDAVFNELLDADENLYIEPPFYCDYGSNIKAGKNLFINFNCCILDVALVTIGHNVMLAPNVQIYTATHPLQAELRNSGQELGQSITIGNNVWIGGNSTICPGVTLGDNVVVGAGSVVTKSFPKNVVVAGNPAKVIKTIDNS
ncbi:maltose O-acetyltransferase [Formosa agariphila KMM 3901]|uniref:Acetyltransferase n=1 Tax=Formosa agariphila (strain DSM 15362 / KCTC 12365 / LMG 23005 / KMM 3901 / M-2Alg 35-1) TaxID=1347342 RepID=T2KHV4_FORAG|nr:sugar O-acetyltransferase [Formosa agariphila]CDF78006.1 maltose O-acetyltransferase [Formosa agariphila KMM 3901]